MPPQSPNRASPASKRARVEPTAREPSVGGAEARGNTSSAVSEEKPEGATTANDQIYRARKQALAARAAMRRADWAVRTRNELDEALKPTHAVDFEDLTRNPL